MNNTEFPHSFINITILINVKTLPMFQTLNKIALVCTSSVYYLEPFPMFVIVFKLPNIPA